MGRTTQAEQERNAYELATMAETYSPDSTTSPGAEWLIAVADDFAENLSGDEWDEDRVHEIADGAVPVYTHERWTVFVDLGAYNEDVSELGASVDDLTQAAGVALYMIAERLVHALHAADVDSDDDESDES